jgi:hypothetical protein
MGTLAMKHSIYSRYGIGTGMVIVLLLSGCGGQSATPGTTPQGVTPQSRLRQASGSSSAILYVSQTDFANMFTYPGCGPPPESLTLEVLYPIPNTRNAPPALKRIYISTKRKMPRSNSFNLYLLQANGKSTFTSRFLKTSESKIPTPHAAPSYPNPIYYGSLLPPSYIIGRDQAVRLLWNDGGTGCTPNFVISRFKTK